MRGALLALTLALSGAFLGAPAFAHAYVSPGQPSGYVNDFAGVLSEGTKSSIEAELAAYDASTTNQIAVATVKDLGTDYIENYAVKLFEDWKIGTAKNDNGVLILIAVQDRRMRIEVGYGLEGVLTDSVANSIIRYIMTPRLKAGDYDGAVTGAVHAVMDATAGEYKGAVASKPAEWNDTLTVIVLGFIVIQWLASVFSRSKSIWAGGVAGAIAGGIIASYFHLWVETGVLVTAGLAGLGVLFDFAVSNAFQDARDRGINPPWWTGGAGGLGGFGGGGGFGGFGGGSSGGGGASGSW